MPTHIVVSSRACEQDATPATSPSCDDGAILASIVEMREAQAALARIEGGAALLASLRTADIGGPDNPERDTLSSLGKDVGISVKASNLVGRDRRMNDAAIKMGTIESTP